ncbi:hypothetical protein EZV61_03960 [Corallincola luteus]|uniref:Right handed beta helix domain-containing protein n=1 Tax=Corallincola luteus TaxID=1775177 RepID=A0ABY2APM6_9GAMM|nr:choice-of-anchor Q domain-containing protein [Corallincola luteus]TCI05125.1 hypothetical protein EZV61_03960 [Corallincola luteus]
MKHGSILIICLLLTLLSGCNSDTAKVVVSSVIDDEPDAQLEIDDYEKEQLGREAVDPVPTQLRYTGLRTDAQLTQDNFSHFVSAYGLRPHLSGDTFESLKAMRCRSGSGYATNDLGIEAVPSQLGPMITLGTYKTVAKGCNIGQPTFDGDHFINVTFNGQSSIEIEETDPEMGPKSLRYHFDRWRVTYADGSFIQYDGVVQLIRKSEHRCDQVQVFNISVTTNMEDEGVLLEELVVDTDCKPADNISSKHLKHTKITGNIYHHKLGKVTISSDDAIFNIEYGNSNTAPGGYRSVSDNAGLNSYVFFSDIPGVIDYQSDGTISLSTPTTAVTLTNRIEPDKEPEYRRSTTPIDIFLTPVQEEPQLIAEVPSWFVYYADPLDLNDTDNDGMWNSWESIYGLDPEIDDASIDTDGEGLTNLEEFQFFTNPQDPSTGTGSAKLKGFSIEYIGPTPTQREFFGDSREYFIPYGYSQPFVFEMSAEFTTTFAQLVPNIDMTVQFPEGRDSYELDTELDCAVVSDELGNRIECPLLPTKFSAFARAPKNKLTITGGEVAHSSCAVLKTQSTRPLDPPWDANDFCYVALGKPLPPNVASSSQAYILDDLWVENLFYPIQLEPVTYAEADSYTVTIEMDENKVAVAPLSFRAGLNGAKCSIEGPLKLTCQGSLTDINDVAIKYKVPETQGSVKVQMEITSLFSSGTSIESKVERTLAFGQSTDTLQSLINDAISASATELVLPEGIYIGALNIAEEINLRGDNTAVWLTKTNYQGKHSSYTIENPQSLRLANIELYLRDMPLTLNSGIVDNSDITVLGKVSKEAFLADGLCDGSLVISSNHITVEQSHIMYDESTDDTALIRVASSAQNSHCTREFKNNVVRGKGMGHTLFFDQSVHGSEMRNDSYNNVIANNTLIDLPSLLKLDNPDNTSSLVANNLQLLNHLQDAAELIELNVNQVIGSPAAFIDLRGNMLMFSAPFQAEANYVVPPEIPFPDLIVPSPDSATVDLGIDLTEWLHTDVEGNPRPSGEFFDIGAYEYQQ